MNARILALLGACALYGLATPVAAQTEARAAVAEALYRQARDLMAAGNYAEACPKFAESQKLDPATGTLLNLASCHEREGKLATAWLEYSDAMVAARRDAREDRVQYASARAAELYPRLSRLILSLAPGADVAGLTVEFDGTSVGRAIIGAPTPVDAGKHTVKASAPGKKTQTFDVNVGSEAEQKSLQILQFEDAPPTPATPTPPATPPATAPIAPVVARDELTARPIPTSVYVVGGVTLALAASAGATGVAYLNKRKDYEASGGNAGRNQALTFGRINLGLWIGAAVGAGITSYLYATRPSRDVALRVTPLLGPQVAGMGVSGGF